MTPKECGTCHHCCTLAEVQEIGKPAGQTCPNLKCITPEGPTCNGCTIYDRRPVACKKFECLWKQSPVLGDDLKPDKCQVLFEAYHQERVVFATATRPNAWAEGKPWILICQMIKDGYLVWVLDGKDRHLMLPSGITVAEAEDKTLRIWRSTTWQSQATHRT